MMKRICIFAAGSIFMTFLMLFGSAFTGAPSPQPADTQPEAVIRGHLFFDLDASGAQNDVHLRYYDGLIHPKASDPIQNPDFVTALEHYLLFNPGTNDGTWITLTEPSLSNFKVCVYRGKAEAGCAVTDIDGNFSVAGSGIRLGESTGIRIIDNSKDKTGGMKFTNRFIGPVVIPAYEMDGVQVPEQTLADTTIRDMADPFYISASADVLQIGLIQGYLRYPLLNQESYVYSFFDHDSRPAYGLDWRGRTGLTLRAYNMPPNKLIDNEFSTDFGGRKGDFVLAAAPGFIMVDKSEIWGNQILLLVNNMGHTAFYGHLDKPLVKHLQRVYAGQIIGVIGQTGKDVGAPQVRFTISNTGIDPFGDPKGKMSQLWTRGFSPAEFP
jgi:murein DD-endopeptidase MepM/ murein hydrolase activator NlpD